MHVQWVGIVESELAVATHPVLDLSVVLHFAPSVRFAFLLRGLATRGQGKRVADGMVVAYRVADVLGHLSWD